MKPKFKIKKSNREKLQTESINDRQNNWVASVVIVLLVFVFYGNTLSNDFAYDDKIVVSENKFIAEGIDGIPEILKYDLFSGHYGIEKNMVVGGRYRPLSLMFFAIEYEVFGKSPFWFHLFNLLYYILACIVLYKFLTLFLKKYLNTPLQKSIPFIASIIYTTHPVHTEVVANIKGRDEILSLLFVMLTLLMFLKYLDFKKIKYLLFSLFSFWLALMSKETAITIFAIIPFLIIYRGEKSKSNIFKYTSAFIIPVSVFLIIRYNVVGFTSEELSKELMNNPFLEMTFLQKYSTIFYTLALYLKLLVFPHPLTIDYYPYHIPIIEPTNIVAIFSLIFYVFILVVGILNVKRNIVLSFSILFYLFTLSITSNLFFPVGVFMNERFIFLSSLGFSLILAYYLVRIFEKYFNNKYSGKFVFVFIFLTVVLFGIKTIDRNADWKDSFTLFANDVEISKNSAKSNAMAGEYYLAESQKTPDKIKQKEYLQNSIKYLNRAIEIYPKHAIALYSLAAAYFYDDFNYKKSIEIYLKILNISAFEQRALEGSYKVLEKCTDVEFIDESYRKLISLNKNSFYSNLGYSRFLVNNTKDSERALNYIEEAIKLNPKNWDAYNVLGVILIRLNRVKESAQAFEKALSFRPKEKQVINNLAIIYNALGDKDKSEYYLQLLKSLPK